MVCRAEQVLAPDRPTACLSSFFGFFVLDAARWAAGEVRRYAVSRK